MVKVKAVHQRVGRDEKPFVTLELMGDIELVQSQNTGRFYATCRRCFVSSTFDVRTAEQFIGSTMPGKIVRVPCDPYDYRLPESGEEILLAHRYDYVPDEFVPLVQRTEKRVSAPLKDQSTEEILNVVMK